MILFIALLRGKITSINVVILISVALCTIILVIITSKDTHTFVGIFTIRITNTLNTCLIRSAEAAAT